MLCEFSSYNNIDSIRVAPSVKIAYYILNKYLAAR